MCGWKGWLCGWGVVGSFITSRSPSKTQEMVLVEAVVEVVVLISDVSGGSARTFIAFNTQNNNLHYFDTEH